MARVKFMMDAERCIDCSGCVVACKEGNHIPVGINRRKVITINQGKPGEKSISVACMHCDDAPCIAVCPVDAIYQREDGSYYHAGIETHDTIEDMLRYVHLSPEELMTYYRDKVASAKLSAKERTQYIDALRLGLTRSSYLTP